MEKFISYVIAFVLVVGISLGALWITWLLWSWVMPQIWATGPDSLIRPSYWLFAGAWVLFAAVGRAIFGRK